jgi:hypothetical protein
LFGLVARLQWGDLLVADEQRPDTMLPATVVID